MTTPENTSKSYGAKMKRAKKGERETKQNCVKQMRHTLNVKLKM